MNEALKQQIAIVADTRAAMKNVQELKRQSLAKWETDNAEILTAEVTLKSNLAEDETVLRDMTIAIFKATGDKHPDQNVGIREGEKLEYGSKDALEWAKTHGLALTLDKSAFEKIVKTDPTQFEFVTVTPVVTATIATEIKLEETK